MDKLTMAHEFYIANKDNYIGTSFSDIAKQCFGYADAMQAEADKSKEKGVPDVIRENSYWYGRKTPVRPFFKKSNNQCSCANTTFGGGLCLDCGANLCAKK